MNSGKAVLLILFSVLFLIQTAVLIKNKKLISGILLTAIQGICALFAVNLIGSFIDVRIPVNFWTLSTSGLFGISGVIVLLVTDILFLTR